MSQNDKDFAPINIEVDERRPSGNRKEQSTNTPEVSGGSNVLTSIVLVAAIAACAFSGYLYTQLEQAKIVAADSKNRLDSLEKRLSATGEEMDNSAIALSVKVTELSEKTDVLWGEMDKLWASAWRRNQEDIKTLTNTLNNTKGTLDSDVNTIQASLADAATDIQQTLNRLNGLNEQLATQANDILAANVNAEQAGEKVSEQSSKLKALGDKISALESKNSNLLDKISDLESLLLEIARKTV